MSSLSLYPTPTLPSLKQQFLNKHLNAIEPPAHILDLAVVRKNCTRMLETVEKLGVDFRAHVKSHKTTELTKLQVGEKSKSIRLIASTVAEIENLVPWLEECVQEGKAVNILYGLPLWPSAIPRLAAVARTLGPGTVSVFADHPAHIQHLENIEDAIWPGRIPVFVNIDVGDHREGVAPHSQQLADVASSISSAKKAKLSGLYAYASGGSYGSKSPDEALGHLANEMEELKNGVLSFAAGTEDQGGQSVTDRIILSLGDTPTVTSAESLLEDTAGAVRYRAMLAKLAQTYAVEFHAGNYPVLDMQQLATRARPTHFESDPHTTVLTSENIGVRTLVEVASVYPDRSEKPQALVAGGTLAFGREPCKDYPGWGLVTPWPKKSGSSYDIEGSRTGWILGSISQEHGVLTWEGPRDRMRPLEIGEKIMIWPNHACIAGAQFGWYLVVDSNSDDPDIVRDVWLRWRGW